MRKFLPLVLITGLAGCADPMTNMVLGGATAVSYSVLGQSPGDYALSRAMHKNCDVRNPKRYDGEYCVDQNQALLTDPPVYCYRTIGSPDCSSQLDPHNSGAHPIVMPADQSAVAPPTASPLPVYDVDKNQPVSLTPAARLPAPVAPLNHEDNSIDEDKGPISGS